VTCRTCHHPIQPGQPSDTFNGEDFHENPVHCITATEAATALKCAAALCKRCASGQAANFDKPRNDFYHTVTPSIIEHCRATEIRRRFQTAFESLTGCHHCALGVPMSKNEPGIHATSGWPVCKAFAEGKANG